MRATFNNRLKIMEQTAQSAPRIVYKNTRRVSLNIYIDYQPAANNNPAPQRDWRITLEGESGVVQHMREIIVSEIMVYLKQRADKKYGGLSFLDILALADMRSIQ